mmetsp:Transcript_8619/g.17520  ORF Transcript_8619/g.17520 Transcript_8619/m.17520 type:complete len:192 (-) Transcript_8619:432-1007(-)
MHDTYCAAHTHSCDHLQRASTAVHPIGPFIRSAQHLPPPMLVFSDLAHIALPLITHCNSCSPNLICRVPNFTMRGQGPSVTHFHSQALPWTALRVDLNMLSSVAAAKGAKLITDARRSGTCAGLTCRSRGEAPCSQHALKTLTAVALQPSACKGHQQASEPLSHGPDKGESSRDRKDESSRECDHKTREGD